MIEGTKKLLAKYFIPNGENGYRPYFFRRESALALLLVIVVVELVYIAQITLVFKKTDFLSAVLPGVLSAMTNDERASSGVGALAENDLLVRAASLKAEDMAKRGYFSHAAPSGELPWAWLEKVGYAYSYAGENLAVNFSDSADVAAAWMNSPSHRANIVNKNFTEFGIGVTRGVYQGREAVFVVEFFGAPLLPLNRALSEKGGVGREGQSRASAPITSKVLTQGGGVLGETTALPGTAVAPPKPSLWSSLQRIITSPRRTTANLLGLMFLFLVLALILTVFVKRRIQHPRLILAGAALIFMVGYLYLWNARSFGFPPDLPKSDYAASVIMAER